MRRKDREITSFDEQLKIIDQCDVVRLGLVDDEGYPYILPLNFGYEVVDKRRNFSGQSGKMSCRESRDQSSIDYFTDL